MSKECTPNDGEMMDPRFEEIVDSSFEQAEREVMKSLEQKLVIGLIGNVNSGKSSLMNALFGEDICEVSPIAGWVGLIKPFCVPGCEQVVIADTPGLQDVNVFNSAKTEKFMADCDLYLFVLNSTVGCTDSERQVYQGLLETGRPVLALLNRIDVHRPVEVEQFISATKEQLGALSEPFIGIAANPGEGRAPINIDAVHDWIMETTTNQGKGLLYAKAARHKSNSALKVIQRSVVEAAAIGALPLPGSDYVLLTALQLKMLMKLSEIYGATVDREYIKKFLVQVVTGQVGKQVFRAAVTALKAVGWLPGGLLLEAAVCALAAGIAASMTYALGRVAILWFESDMEMSFEELELKFKELYEKHRGEGGEGGDYSGVPV